MDAFVMTACTLTLASAINLNAQETAIEDRRAVELTLDGDRLMPNENVASQAALSRTTSAHWLDRTQSGLHRLVWRTASRIDGLFGAQADEAAYQEASGSLSPALLWDEFGGFEEQFRFRANLPLPQLDERVDAFIGRVNREEYVTERAEESGAFRRQYGSPEPDETLFGIRYREPRQGGHFDAGAGLRVRSPLDPYVKGSWRFDHGASDRTLLSLKETVFWQNSEEFGLTSRLDIERVFDPGWLVRGTISGTFSPESQGVRGYTTLTMMRGFPGRRAVAAELFMSGEFDANVPTEEYGMKFAYRRSVMRDWLVLEVRSSLTWPKDLPEQSRKPNWGVGVGFEMYFGDAEFSAKPVTF